MTLAPRRTCDTPIRANAVSRCEQKCGLLCPSCVRSKDGFATIHHVLCIAEYLTEIVLVRKFGTGLYGIRTMPSAKTVNLDAHAVATLRYIRASMDAAAGVAVPGSAGIAMGIVGFAAAAICLLPPLQRYWVFVWLSAAPLAAGVGGVLLARPNSPLAFVAQGTAGRKLAFCLLPSLFGGAAMTIVLWSGAHMSAIPGTWLLLYGCALISASVPTTTLVAWMGVSFVGLGIAALFAPFMVQMILLGLGFGGLHILFGILMGRIRNGRES